MSLTMMGLTPGPLIHALFFFALENPLVVLTTPLVVFVVWSLAFCSNSNQVNWWHFSVDSVCTNRSWVQSWSTYWNILAPKVLIFPPNFKISFIAIFLLWPSRDRSNCCSFVKNMIQCRPMGSICRPSDSYSGGTKGVELILCVDGWDPQIHEI